MLFQQSAGSFLLPVVVLTISITSAQEINHGPENITVFLNQPANFTCEVTSGVTAWKVNTTSENELPPKIRANIKKTLPVATDRGSVVTLTINALADYNGTTFQCVTFGDFEDESEIATITIQGPVSAVGDLKVTESSTSIIISWGAPFSLDVTDVDPDIWYSVLIYNVTDENSPTAILCTDCINITETHYTFTPKCFNKYNVSVVPFNGAGQGERSKNLTINLVPVIETHVEFFSRSECRVTLSSSDEFCKYRILFEEMYSCFGIPRGPLGELATCYFAADAKYSLPLILFNDTGGVTTIVIDLTTFDVQNATVNAAGNGLIVTVNFIANTTATGCFIVLQSEDGSPDEFRALLRPESETTLVATIDSVPPSTYTMLFYDLEQDGLPNSNVAYERSKITVDGTVTDAPSRFLKSGSELFLTGTAVTVRCEFKEGIEGASCVLVYREYGNKILVVEEYPQNTVFPVTLTVDGDPEKYTYAIFGRSNSDFDGRPIVTKKFQVSASPSIPSPTLVPTVTATDEEGAMETQVAAISIGTALAGVMICLTAVLVLLVVVRQCHTHRKKLSAVPTPTTTSSIPTELSHTTTIPTTGNVASPINTTTT